MVSGSQERKWEGNQMELKDRIPTINEDQIRSKTALLAEGFNFPPSPTLAEINNCVIRIIETEDLSSELEERGIDIRQIAHVIANARHKKELWEGANLNKSRAKAYARDLKALSKRHDQKPPRNYSPKIAQKAAIEAEVKKYTAYAEAEKIKRSSTKKRPYLTRLLVPLDYILSVNTDNPYKLMAGLFNLLNLRPEKACEACQHFDTLWKKCSKSLIFECPNHSNTRHSLWQMTQVAKEESADLHTRLQDPENQF